jgi:hypothetical protein
MKDPALNALIGSLPWRTARRDVRAVVKLLDRAELERESALRLELEAMFHQRVSECRDFFVLRGVRPRRPTVLQMAGRSLASDRDQIARLDQITPGMGFALLRALSQLIETWARSGRMALA